MHRLTRPERRSRIQRRHCQDEVPLLNPPAPPAAVPAPKQKRRWWLGLFLLLCLVGSATLSYLVFSHVGESVPRELAGIWQVTEGPLQGATLEFRRDGTVVASKSERGTRSISKSSARVDGKKIFLTSRDDLSGQEDTVVQVIVRLTEDELIIRDMDKHIYRMKRVGS
jgi:hypothetical protein